MILNNAELYYVQMDPKRPAKAKDKNKPDYWVCQVRTTDKEVKKAWQEANINATAVVPDEGEPYYKVSFKRNTINAKGEEAECPEIVNGNLDTVDPTTIGNGSIGNIRLFQHKYEAGDGFAAGISSVLMGLQLTKHIIYVKDKEEFSKTETEVISPETKSMVEEDDVTY